MTESQKVIIKNKFFRLCDLYLVLFIVLGTIVSAYIGITNHKAHEAFFNKPLIAGFFLTIATATLFLLRVETRVNIALSHFFIFFSLFLGNALFEIPFFADYNSAKSAALRAGVEWDTRAKYAVIEDYRKEGINAYPSANFSAFVQEREFFTKKFNLDFEHKIFPLNGISYAKTVLCNESGKWVSYISDRYGFNNSDGVYENTRDSIILVGDSFSHGDCVEPGDDIAGNLRRRGHTAITLGTGGNGPLIELATLREYGPSLTPKVILWMYFEGNDFLDLPVEYNYPPLKKYLSSAEYTQGLVQKQDVIDKFWIDFFDLVKEDFSRESGRRNFWDQDRSDEIKGLFLRIVSLHNIRKRVGLSRSSYMFKPEEKSSNENEMMFKTVMEAALAEAKKLNCKLYFVYLPTFESFFNDKYLLAPSSQAVRKVVSELNIPLIDFFGYLKGTGDPANYFPFRKSGHYNPEGYDLLADLIEIEALQSR